MTTTPRHSTTAPRSIARWHVLIATGSALVGGCAPDRPLEPDGPRAADDRPVVARTLLVNEVVFDGARASVEIINAGASAVALSDAVLVDATGEVAPLPSEELAPGALRVLELPGGFVSGLDDALTLQRSDGDDPEVLDHVAWGPSAAAATPFHVGGVPLPAPERWVLARGRGTRDVSPLAWQPLDLEEATLGAPSPPPRVALASPLDGAEVEGDALALRWVPPAGAASYRVQVTSPDDTGFAAPVVDTTTAEPALEAPLDEGTWSWRVQAIDADGEGGVWFPGGGVTHHPPGRGRRATDAVSVPFTTQHKDTAMLLLESQHENGAHAWNVDHQHVDTTDPADNMNCLLASLAMINGHFAGGRLQLSQDRIGYEILKDRAPGPERDLMHGGDSDFGRLQRAIDFALGEGSSTQESPSTPEAVFDLVRGEVHEHRRPVLLIVRSGTRGSHAIVATGYVEDAVGHGIVVHDPMHGASVVHDVRSLRVFTTYISPKE